MEKRLLFSKIQIYTHKREISLKNLDVLIANKKKKGKKKTMFKKKKRFGANQSNIADDPKFLLPYQLW